MKKFAIELTKGDNSKILATFNSKDDALVSGKEFRKQVSRDNGLLSCIEAEFDENNNIIGSGYKLHKVFM